MGFLLKAMKERFEAKKPKALQADIRMISGCDDHQTSADVSSVADFELPDPAGRAGGACTSTLLNVLYKDHADSSEDLEARNFTQIPQVRVGELVAAQLSHQACCCS